MRAGPQRTLQGRNEVKNKPIEGKEFIEFHADDYGMCPDQSRRIRECITGGAANGISIMANSPYLTQCMEELGSLPGVRCPWNKAAQGKELFVAVHLNLVHGKALTPKEQIPDLVSEDGTFNRSFAQLFLRSLMPGGYKELRRQICLEYRAQIRAAMPWMDPEAVRLDSHVHYHMIPVCFDAMMDAAAAEQAKISYIRIPRENIGLYLRHLKELSDFHPVNIVKVLILNLFARRNLKKNKDVPALKDPADFAGVALSGRMTPGNAGAILPDALELAKKRHAQGKPCLEMLFHPGAVYIDEDIRQLNNPGDREFLTDKLREMEAKALKELSE